MSKGDLADDVAAGLLELGDSRGCTLNLTEEGPLAKDLCKLNLKTLKGLGDLVGILKTALTPVLPPLELSNGSWVRVSRGEGDHVNSRAQVLGTAKEGARVHIQPFMSGQLQEPVWADKEDLDFSEPPGQWEWVKKGLTPRPGG